MAVYGVSCFVCRYQFNGTEGEPQAAVERRASDAGWCIGHLDGQGHIVCPDHRECVWDASSLCLDGYVS